MPVTSQGRAPARLSRLVRALAREGLDVTHADGVYTIRLRSDPNGPAAEVLLSDELPLEAKAATQLAQIAALQHPDGGRLACVCATPDFHPGDGGVPIGTVARSRTIVTPGLVGGDINCGMRLHVTDLSLDRLLSRKAELVGRLRRDYLLGERDIALTGSTFEGLLREGLPGLALGARERPLGRLRRVDLDRLREEIDQVYLGGALPDGDPSVVPASLLQSEVVREDGLATVGRGNHFVELQVVEELVDRGEAWRLGVKVGQVTLMIHSGSRDVGRAVGTLWADRARAAWPADQRYPDSRIFPISLSAEPGLALAYLRAEAAAANYGWANRALLAELFRTRLEEVFGQVSSPLVADVPHNITLREGDDIVARKGATPAHPGQALVIPGSMGSASYLLVGRGQPRFLSSASHGAGRARPRQEMGHLSRDQLGLSGVECHTLREERVIEEAPAGYKPISAVIDAQVRAGMVGVVARMRPLMTFKG